MNNTFILLARSLLDSEVFASQKMLKIWIWCLLRANFKERKVPIKVGKGERIITVKRGQFLFGRFRAEDELFIDGSTIYKIMKKLEELGNITIQSSSQYSIITICNYDSYQNPESYKVATEEQPSNNRVTTEEQPSNTNNKDNKVNKEKNIPPDIKDVIAYCDERNKGVDPNKWFDFYQSKGWYVGKNKMKDWKAAVRTWEDKTPDNKTKGKDSGLEEYHKMINSAKKV